MGLFDFLFGKKSKVQQVPTFSPEQQNLFNQLLSGQGGVRNEALFRQAEDALMNLLNPEPEASRAYTNQAVRDFEQSILPGIAEQFAGAGAGALGSSGFRNASIEAGRRLAENLAVDRLNRQQGAISQAFNASQIPFSQQLSLLAQRPFNSVQREGSLGLIPSFLTGVAGPASEVFTSSFLQPLFRRSSSRLFGGL